ncbi:MAG TPA: hypothetical protein VK822_18085 [Acetobacteraceae bacterium]|jgi:uncharacterized protein (PEP-CTERM system associated)|nr:hypothetical protein [Acetobacteraceae bacterium]HTB44526.1 hypothetical protein [Acetobacteraceae bacterium]
MSGAAAFPLSDQINPSIVPGNSDLATPDVTDLQHQMGLASGFASLGSQQGWTILPRLSLEEEFTDNVFEVGAPRRWDLTTIVAPGVTVLGDSDRTQLRLDYEPDLEIHLINGSQNLLAQQFNGVGTVTLVPELFFVDVRAVAGVQASNGGIGGLGTLGQNGVGGITGASLGQGQTVDAGVAKNDRTQTASFSISPYMLFQFGDIGTGKIGTTLSESTASSISGFAPVPLVSGGTNDQHLSSFEQYAQFQSGDVLSVIRDTASADAMQSTSGGTGVTSSTRATVSNRVDYQINVSIDVYGQIGYEDISYSGNSALEIHDITWGVGTVLTPNPDSQLSLGYGHENGANTFTASGHYALTARTILTVSYNNGVGTQLEQVNQQLNQASVANNGSLVNSQSGTQLFVNNNALGVTQGIYRYNYLTFGATTILDRDTFGVTIGNSQQTQLGAKTQTSNGVTTGTLSWTHELSPDLVATATAAASLGTPTAGNNSKSYVAGLSLQYIITDTLSAFARYSFYDVQSSAANQSWYQDLFLVGITKQF